jgi:hypothetical protein
MSEVFALNLRSIAKRERDIGHSELAAIIEQAADEIERLCGLISDLRATKAEYVRLHLADGNKIAEAAAFLDRMADSIHPVGANELAGSVILGEVEDDCRAMAKKLRGEREYDPNVAPCDDAEFGMKP